MLLIQQRSHRIASFLTLFTLSKIPPIGYVVAHKVPWQIRCGGHPKTPPNRRPTIAQPGTWEAQYGITHDFLCPVSDFDSLEGGMELPLDRHPMFD